MNRSVLGLVSFGDQFRRGKESKSLNHKNTACHKHKIFINTKKGKE